MPFSWRYHWLYPMLVPEITALIFSGGDALSFTGSLYP